MNVQEFAKHWANELGCREESISGMRGGINNYVYRCNRGQSYWVIKGYPKQRMSRDKRMKAEVEFLKYANEVAPRYVPALIAADDKHSCIILEYITGSRFMAGVTPAQEAVEDAVRFFEQLNRDFTTAQENISMDATEGFLSLTDHLANIQKRLERIDHTLIPCGYRTMGKRLIEEMKSDYERIWRETQSLINGGVVGDAMRREDRCVSPGDFGFHNAIWTEDGVKFFDFEFSGWDDPAKTMLDFALQPRVPVRQKDSPLGKCLSLGSNSLLVKRVEALRPILSLKWQCIMMSVLSKEKLESLMSRGTGESMEAIILKRINDAVRFRNTTMMYSIPQ